MSGNDKLPPRGMKKPLSNHPLLDHFMRRALTRTVPPPSRKEDDMGFLGLVGSPLLYPQEPPPMPPPPETPGERNRRLAAIAARAMEGIRIRQMAKRSDEEARLATARLRLVEEQMYREALDSVFVETGRLVLDATPTVAKPAPKPVAPVWPPRPELIIDEE